MMVRDMAKQHAKGLPHFSGSGWYGIQDGGASSVVVGHETLTIDHMQHRGVAVDRYLFMATDKMFGFGGDTSRRADWSVRLPVHRRQLWLHGVLRDQGRYPPAGWQTNPPGPEDQHELPGQPDDNPGWALD